MDISRTIKAGFSRLVAKAMTSQTISPSDFWMQGGGVSFTGGIANAYEKSAIVYGCVSRRARDLSGVPLLFLRDPKDATSEVEQTDPVRLLFESPLPGFSTEQFLLHADTVYLLRGEAFVAFDDPGNPKEMVPYFDPIDFHDETMADKRLVKWTHRKMGRTWLPSEIMQIRTVNINDPYRGLSPLQAAANAYQIDSKGDKLQAETIDQGGERGVVFMTSKDDDRTEPQQEKLLKHLQSRRTGGGAPKRDTLIPYVEVLDPKLTEADMNLLTSQEMSADKIADVYGTPLFMLGRADAPNFATAQMLVENYWRGTVLPDMRAWESVWDRFFVRGPMRSKVYVRFDRSRIHALQGDYSVKVDNASKLVGLHVPMVEINRALELGLDDSALPTGTDPLVSSTLAPISTILEEWSGPQEPEGNKMAAPVRQQPAPVDALPTGGRLTQKMIRRRASNPRSVISRNRRLGRMERGLRNDWRNMMGGFKVRAGKLSDALLADQTDPAAAAVRLADMLERELMAEMEDKALDLVAPYHIKAATEGVLAIQELLGEKISHADRDMFLKAPVFNEEATAAIGRRGAYFKGKKSFVRRLFQTVRDWMLTAVEDGSHVTELAEIVLGRFNVSINRAMTIGRTEVGSAYNVGRFTEMGAQGIQKHEWMTSLDEFTRDGVGEEFDHAQCNGEVRKIGDQFPCGLAYPMEEGGEAGNVINCRCETIPSLEGL